MNSVHDIGGMDGFGPLREEAGEPVFHQPWEGRTFGMAMFSMPVTSLPLDALRHAQERQEPVQYLAASYYQRMLGTLEKVLIEVGTLSSNEIDAKCGQFLANPGLPVPRREVPETAASIPAILRAGNPVTRKIGKKPRFAIGDRVMTRNLNPHGHTRLPRYTRSKHGVITAHHGAHVFPDTNAHGLGENPQHLYTVRISARELRGDTAEPNECILIDLWESYLAPDGITAKAPSAKDAAPAKVAKAKLTKATPAKSLRMKPKMAAPKRNPARSEAKATRKKSR
jgi:nitrile hydratase beta subunit